jgi:hypothetical protein
MSDHIENDRETDPVQPAEIVEIQGDEEMEMEVDPPEIATGSKKRPLDSIEEHGNTAKKLKGLDHENAMIVDETLEFTVSFEKYLF